MTTRADDPAGWTRVRLAPRVTIALPPGLSARGGTGVDSLAGEYVGPSLELRYDYGLFADPLAYAAKPAFREEAVTVGGQPARQVTFADAAEGSARPHVAAIHFPRLPDGNRLTVYIRAKTPGDLATAKRILQSITFP